MFSRLPLPVATPGHIWFSPNGCVVKRADDWEVIVAGTVIARFAPDDLGGRYSVLVGLAEDRRIQRKRLAKAFAVSVESLRLLCKVNREQGLAGVMRRKRGGSESRVTPAFRTRLEKMFEKGLSINDALRRLGKTPGISRASVGEIRKRWARARQPVTDTRLLEQLSLGIDAKPEPRRPKAPALSTSSPAQAPPVQPSSPEVPAAHVPDVKPGRPEASAPSTASPAQVSPVQPSSPEMAAGHVPDAEPQRSEAPTVPAPTAEHTAPPEPISGAARAPREKSCRESRQPLTGNDEEEQLEEAADVNGVGPTPGRAVPFLGAWVLLALLAFRGLYTTFQAHRPDRLPAHRLRVAIDAVVIALACGGKCVEAVRRLCCAGAGALLTAAGGLSASWVRRILGTFSAEGTGEIFHLRTAEQMIREACARAGGKRVVFYIDGHHRPYTGKHKLRKGWRMQDKRAVAGCTDYWVHDDQGTPLLRAGRPDHGALTQMLTILAFKLRVTLGDDVEIVLVFDRGGAFPVVMEELRDLKNLTFVTWERDPPGSQPRERFSEAFRYRGERYEYAVGGANLGNGRGRVRRIALRTPDGTQLNILSNRDEKPRRLAEALLQRWCQENGFKHGVERWGLNHLDGRQVKAYPPETVIPNPKRAKLKRELKEARAREGALRCKLERKSGATREKLEGSLAEAVAEVVRLETEYKAAPERITVGETDLNGKLVHHKTEYKATLDTIRMACIEAETMLAGWLAPGLKRPEEAKRVLQNLFLATGDLRVTDQELVLTLNPTGTPNELEALRRLFSRLNDLRLVRPGDPKRRPLRFRIQKA